MTFRKRFISAAAAVALAFSALPAVQAAAKPNDPELPINLAAGMTYTLSSPPSASYPDSGNELTDGQYGNPNYSDPKWQAHLRGMERTVTFDLKERQSISSVKAHFLQDAGAGIHFPREVQILVSEDGEKWGTLANIASAIPLYETGAAGLTQNYVWDGAVDGLPRGNPNADMVVARYVQVRFTTDVWVFLDEIEIWGVHGKAHTAKNLPPDNAKPVQDPGYLAPGPATANVGDLVLLYNGWYANGFGNWTKDNIAPYIGYVDENGQPKSWFFDGVLYLGLNAPGGRSFGESSGGASNKQDWEWYLNKTFAPQGDMQQLNEAAKETAQKLGDPNHKVKVTLMIPYPAVKQNNFGDVDGDGVSENFDFAVIGHDEAYKNKQKAVKWYIDKALQLWNDGGYSNLELTSFYWLSEKVSLNASHEEDLIRYTSGLVHNAGKTFLWIPYFEANRFWQWKDLGFDAAVLQPNYFFNTTVPETRIAEAANYAKQYGMGIEIETHEGIVKPGAPTSDGDIWRDRYLGYLNGGVDQGYMKGAFSAYYQGGDTFLKAAQSTDPVAREMYDLTYQYVKGTYTKQ